MFPQKVNPEYVAEVRAIIGSWIKEMRLHREMSQTDLAQQLGVSFGTISKIESGKWISLEAIIKLSIILDFYPFLLEKDSKDELAQTMKNRWLKSHNN